MLERFDISMRVTAFNARKKFDSRGVYSQLEMEPEDFEKCLHSYKWDEEDFGWTGRDDREEELLILLLRVSDPSVELFNKGKTYEYISQLISPSKCLYRVLLRLNNQILNNHRELVKMHLGKIQKDGKLPPLLLKMFTNIDDRRYLIDLLAKEKWFFDYFKDIDWTAIIKAHDVPDSAFFQECASKIFDLFAEKTIALDVVDILCCAAPNKLVVSKLFEYKLMSEDVIEEVLSREGGAKKLQEIAYVHSKNELFISSILNHKIFRKDRSEFSTFLSKLLKVSNELLVERNKDRKDKARPIVKNFTEAGELILADRDIGKYLDRKSIYKAALKTESRSYAFLKNETTRAKLNFSEKEIEKFGDTWPNLRCLILDKERKLTWSTVLDWANDKKNYTNKQQTDQLLLTKYQHWLSATLWKQLFDAMLLSTQKEILGVFLTNNDKPVEGQEQKLNTDFIEKLNKAGCLRPLCLKHPEYIACVLAYNSEKLKKDNLPLLDQNTKLIFELEKDCHEQRKSRVITRTMVDALLAKIKGYKKGIRAPLSTRTWDTPLFSLSRAPSSSTSPESEEKSLYSGLHGRDEVGLASTIDKLGWDSQDVLTEQGKENLMIFLLDECYKCPNGVYFKFMSRPDQINGFISQFLEEASYYPALKEIRVGVEKAITNGFDCDRKNPPTYTLNSVMKGIIGANPQCSPGTVLYTKVWINSSQRKKMWGLCVFFLLMHTPCRCRQPHQHI